VRAASWVSKVARLDADDVARNELGRRDLGRAPVAQHLRLRHLHLREGVDAGPCLQFLLAAQDRVQHHEGAHHDADGDLVDEEARHADDEQHDVHRVLELEQVDRPDRRLGLRGQLVGAVGRLSPLDVLARQA
jgi:hypothetical protein